jgi:hypothetical protein
MTEMNVSDEMTSDREESEKSHAAPTQIKLRQGREEE